jgi:ribosomal-protein-serine acetyltransferase
MSKYIFEKQIDEGLALVIPDVNCAQEIFGLIDKDRDHLRPWLPWVDVTLTVEDTRKNLSERIEVFSKREQAPFYGTLNGEFVASVGFVILSDSEGEIGYWLLSKYSGRGLMTTFVKGCIDYGFDELGLNKIVIKCAEGNVKSSAIPERLGFTQNAKTEVTPDGNGRQYTTLIFTLDLKDWSK